MIRPVPWMSRLVTGVPSSHLANRKLKTSELELSGAQYSARRYRSASVDPNSCEARYEPRPASQSGRMYSGGWGASDLVRRC